MNEGYIRFKALDIPIYRGKFIIIVSNDANKVKKYLPEFRDKSPYAHTWQINWNGNQGFAVVFNFENEHRPIFNGTIAHEALHVVDFILEDRGVQPDFINDEPSAYLLEWIVDEIYRFCEKYSFKPTM